MEFERRAAEAHCSAACDAVSAALRDGHAEGIATAYAALDRAVDNALSASLECEQVRRKVRRELDLLAGGGDGRAVAGHVRRLEGGDPQVIGRVPEISADLTPQGRARHAMRRIRVRLRRRLRRAVGVGRP